MLTVKKMHDDLETWIRIGIGDDILLMPEQRKEYQHLVKANRDTYDHELEKELIPGLVLLDLKFELEQPWFMRPTFWVLLTHWVRSKVMGK